MPGKLDTYHSHLWKLLDQLGERYLANNQAPFGVFSGYFWIPRIRSIIGSDGNIDPIPQPNVAVRVDHSFEQGDASHGDEENDEHNVAIELRKVVSTMNTVTVACKPTSMYALRARHILNKSMVKQGRSVPISFRLLKRRDEHLNEVEWSGIHEFVRRPDQTNGLTRKECQELRLSIIDNLVG